MTAIPDPRPQVEIAWYVRAWRRSERRQRSQRWMHAHVALKPSRRKVGWR